GERGRSLERIACRLLDGESLLAPLEHGWDIEIDVERRVVRRSEIDRVLVLRVILHSRAAAACADVAIAPALARTHRDEVRDFGTGDAVDVAPRGEDLIEETLLVVVHVLRVGLV